MTILTLFWKYKKIKSYFTKTTINYFAIKKSKSKNKIILNINLAHVI